MQDCALCNKLTAILQIITNSIGRDTVLPQKIGLTEQEKSDLESYLIALTDDQFIANKKK